MKVVRNECQGMSEDNMKEVQAWINDHEKKLLQVQAEIRKSTFKDQLEAEFQIWDSSLKYYHQWINCRVTADSISIIEYGQGNDQNDPVNYLCLATVEAA